MNRKKAILLIAAIQAVLLAILMVLFFTGAIKIETFTVSVIVIAIIEFGVIAIAFRKLPPM